MRAIALQKLGVFAFETEVVQAYIEETDPSLITVMTTYKTYDGRSYFTQMTMPK